MNTFCGSNAEFLKVKAGGTYSYHCDLQGYRYPHSKARALTTNTDESKAADTSTLQDSRSGSAFYNSPCGRLGTTLWDMTPCSFVHSYHRFGKTRVLNIQGKMKM
jgi:hypothetical protein